MRKLRSQRGVCVCSVSVLQNEQSGRGRARGDEEEEPRLYLLRNWDSRNWSSRNSESVWLLQSSEMEMQTG